MNGYSENSIADAYLAPSIPDRLPLANAARFWIAFVSLAVGYVSLIGSILAEDEFISLACGMLGLALIYGAKRNEARLGFVSPSPIFYWIMLAGIVSYVLLIVTFHYSFGDNSPLRMSRGFFIASIVAYSACWHLLNVLSSVAALRRPGMSTDRFTDRARVVMQLAQASAERNKQALGSVHVLLGLIEEGSGVASKVLTHLGVDANAIVAETKQIGTSPSPSPTSKNEIGFIVHNAIEEATELNHNYVGTEHLLLGLLQYRDGTAAEILSKLGISADAVRQEIRDLLGPMQTLCNPPASSGASS